jgi:lincosamide and streptogramin A transport system ATP-binding/permease protein
LSFAYENNADPVFEDVSFAFDTNWKCGLIGRNGRGKTTLLKLLKGDLDDQGAITPHLDAYYFPEKVVNESQKTVDVMHEVMPTAEEWELVCEAYELGLSDEDLERSYTLLSSGQKTKALIAALFAGNHPYLLIDEPTNHLDGASRTLLGEYLQRKRGFLLISHDRHLLDLCTDHIIAFNRDSIDVVKGNFSSWYENKTLQNENERRENEKLKKEVKRLKQASQTTANWSDAVEKTKNGVRNSGLRVDRGFVGHKAAKMMQRSKNYERRMQHSIDKASSLLKDEEIMEDLKLTPLRFGKTLVSVSHLSLFYEHEIVHDLNFTINDGDRIALCGLNGCGKSSLMKCILGENINYQGNLTIGNIKIAYVPQDVSTLAGSFKEFAGTLGIELSLLFTILRKMGFSRETFDHNLSALSQGQKKKVALAACFCQSAHLYVLDEPMNYLDIYTRMQIEELILKFTPTLLFCEHDVSFTDRIKTKEILFLQFRRFFEKIFCSFEKCQFFA